MGKDVNSRQINGESRLSRLSDASGQLPDSQLSLSFTSASNLTPQGSSEAAPSVPLDTGSFSDTFGPSVAPSMRLDEDSFSSTFSAPVCPLPAPSVDPSK